MALFACTLVCKGIHRRINIQSISHKVDQFVKLNNYLSHTAE